MSTFTIKLGEDRDITISYRGKGGRALDLTDATVDLTIATAAVPGTVVLTQTTTTYLTPTGTSLPLDSTGKATVTLSDTEVDTLGAGSFVMDAKVRDSAGHDSISTTHQLLIKARRS